MGRKKKEMEAKEAQIRDALIGLELRALSVVLAEWSTTSIKNRSKVQTFRDAMMEGLGKKGLKKEVLEREIVAGEYQVMLDTVNYLNDQCGGKEHPRDVEKRLKRTEIICSIKSHSSRPRTFRRPVPCPEHFLGILGQQLNSGRKPEVIAKNLVLERLYISRTTVNDSLKPRKPYRFDTTAEQRLLVSLFFDASPYCKDDRQLDVQTAILDTLLSVKYPPIAIYYAVQAAHRLIQPISVGVSDYASIKKLCEWISADTGVKSSPFNQLLLSKR